MQPVKVDEPTVEETITILKGIQENTKTTTTFTWRGYQRQLFFQTATSKIASCQTRPLICWMKGSKWTWLWTLWIQKLSISAWLKPKTSKLKQPVKKTLKKQPTSVTKSRNTRNVRGQHVTDHEYQWKKNHWAYRWTKTNISVGDLKEKGQSQLINLASDLKAHVIGQDDAVDKLRKPFDAPCRPRIAKSSTGSFLFCRTNRCREDRIAPNNWRLNSLF